MTLLTPEVSKLIFFHVAEVINSMLSMNVGIYTQLHISQIWTRPHE